MSLLRTGSSAGDVAYDPCVHSIDVRGFAHLPTTVERR